MPRLRLVLVVAALARLRLALVLASLLALSGLTSACGGGVSQQRQLLGERDPSAGGAAAIRERRD